MYAYIRGYIDAKMGVVSPDPNSSFVLSPLVTSKINRVQRFRKRLNKKLNSKLNMEKTNDLKRMIFSVPSNDDGTLSPYESFFNRSYLRGTVANTNNVYSDLMAQQYTAVQKYNRYVESINNCLFEYFTGMYVVLSGVNPKYNSDIFLIAAELKEAPKVNGLDKITEFIPDSQTEKTVPKFKN